MQQHQQQPPLSHIWIVGVVGSSIYNLFASRGTQQEDEAARKEEEEAGSSFHDG